MRRFVCVLFVALISSSVLANPTKPCYPANLNLNNYKTISLSLRSDSNGEIATMEEFRSNENKRSDVKVPSTIASFRAFNGITFSIVTKPSLNEKTCNHIDAAIDGYMFMNTAIGLAWKKNVEGKLIYIGQEQVGDVNCYVWKFTDDENEEGAKYDFQFYTSIPKSSDEKPELKLIKLDKTNTKGKIIPFVYDNIKLEFDVPIDEDKFKIDDDVKCQ